MIISRIDDTDIENRLHGFKVESLRITLEEVEREIKRENARDESSFLYDYEESNNQIGKYTKKKKELIDKKNNLTKQISETDSLSKKNEQEINEKFRKITFILTQYIEEEKEKNRIKKENNERTNIIMKELEKQKQENAKKDTTIKVLQNVIKTIEAQIDKFKEEIFATNPQEAEKIIQRITDEKSKGENIKYDDLQETEINNYSQKYQKIKELAEQIEKIKAESQNELQKFQKESKNQTDQLTTIAQEQGDILTTKNNEIETLKQQISNLTAENKKEKNSLAIVNKEKAEIIQTFNNEVDKKTVELIKNPNLISRYIFELQKRKSIEIGDQEQMLKTAQAMQGLNEKNLEIKETALITKEEKIAHIIQIQGYELKKNNDALSGYFEKLAIEKQKWNLQKERDLLNSDKKLFEIGKQGSYNELSSQQIQLFQQEVNLQLDNKEFDIHQREKFVGLMQHELQIDKKHALNQFTEQAFDLKKRETDLYFTHRDNEFSIKQKEDLHNQNVNMFQLMQKEFDVKEQNGIPTFVGRLS